MNKTPSSSLLEIAAATDDEGEARQWHLLLSAVTMPHRVVDRTEEPLPFDDDAWSERFCLVVSNEDADQVRALIDVSREEDESRAIAQANIKPDVVRSSRGLGLAAAVALSVLLLAIFLRTPGFDSAVSLRLRVDSERIFAGEWYRLLGAAFLHADAGHLFSNIGFLIPLGVFCVERLGVGHFLFAFVWTASLGNFGSVMWHGIPHINVGASGGVFGVLGALVGSALANPQRRRRELLGAGFAFLAMTAFAEKSDMAAHVFGWVAGLAFGMAASRWPKLDTVFGLIAVTASVAVFAGVLQ